MKKLKGLVLLCMVGVFLSGCATPPAPPYKMDPGKSFALNVMTAHGHTDLVDAPDVVYQKPLTKQVGTPTDQKTTPANGNGASLINAGVTAAAVSTSHINFFGQGFSSWNKGLIGAGFALLGTERPSGPAVHHSLIFAWIPTSFATSPNEAEAKMSRLITKSMRRAVSETPLPPGYKIKESQGPPGLLTITGRGCDKSNVVCEYPSIFKSAQPPVVSKAPDFLGGGMSWKWAVPLLANSYLIVDNKDKKNPLKPQAVFPDREIYTRLSKLLPKWAFIYLAPASSQFAVSMKSNKGFVFLNESVVLNQGVLHRFVQP